VVEPGLDLEVGGEGEQDPVLVLHDTSAHRNNIRTSLGFLGKYDGVYAHFRPCTKETSKVCNHMSANYKLRGVVLPPPVGAKEGLRTIS